MTPFTARNAERDAWRAYKAYCLGWRRGKNHPHNWIFSGDEKSHALFAIFRAARRSLQAVSSPRHARNNPRFAMSATAPTLG